MTKQVDSKNQIWFEQNDNVVTVGFTQAFINSLDQCWHIVPANLERFRQNGPLMVVETNDALISIKSPVAANYTSFNPKAQNFPDQLTENDVILEMRIGPVQRQTRTTAAIPTINAEWSSATPAARVGSIFEGASMVNATVDFETRVQIEQERQRNAMRASLRNTRSTR